MTTIAELRNSLSGPSEEYRRKQLHAVPEAKVVNREEFILSRVAGKVVLDIGASGRMHEAICKAARFTYGIDRPCGKPWGQSDVVLGGRCNIYLDLDLDERLPRYDEVEIIVCGEVIEHLSNPGWFLKRLRGGYRCPVIITVPNAFCDSGRRQLEGGIENVNSDHVAYYSFHTLSELVRREGYKIREHYWYNGRPRFAEGLIFVVE